MPTPAERLAPLLSALVGAELPVRLRCWDGGEWGPAGASAVVVLRRRRALRTLVWQPDELGLGRAYVSGDLDIDGDMYAVFDIPGLVAKLAGHGGLSLSRGEKLRVLVTALRLGAVGPRPPLPPEEVRQSRRRRGRRVKHSPERDAGSVRHHYDVGNDFYRLVLGPSLVYSCAYWAQPAGLGYGLEQAQRDKLELICRKLGLQPGMRVLDVGCGWGSLALHAARYHGVRVLGVTLSGEQASLARHRVAQAGLSERVEIRVQDYREVGDGPYDAIASVGMSEHVGAGQFDGYCQALFALLRPGGRLLNHAIACPPSGAEDSVEPRPSFMDRYVFPDGEVLPLGMVTTDWNAPVSRSVTPRICGSTTRRPCAPGWTTSTATGRPLSTTPPRAGPGSGRSTWWGRHWPSTAGKSRSTRCWPSSATPKARPTWHPPETTGYCPTLADGYPTRRPPTARRTAATSR